MDQRKTHWEAIYNEKSDEDLSWTQVEPNPSLPWITETLSDRSAGIIDVGAGASVLIDRLLDQGYRDITVLDISLAALQRANERLGGRGSAVKWVEADATEYVSERSFSLWHDRAVFHFLTNRSDREKYIENVKRSLIPGGFVVIGTFSPQGPEKCSGLNVMRYDESGLDFEFGTEFKRIKSTRVEHTTPWGTSQAFLFCLYRFVGGKT